MAIIRLNQVGQSEYERRKIINKKTAQTRRQRGYNWEDTLVKRFNSVKFWKAFRLGSPSVALPDVLTVNNLKSTIFTIEAKSGTGTTLHVPFLSLIHISEPTRPERIACAGLWW